MSPRLERGTLRFLLLLGWAAAVAAVVFWRVGAFWEDPEDHMREARAALREGRTVRALAAARRALEEDSSLAGAWTFKGYRELDLGRPDSAARSFHRAMRGDRAGAEARLGLGRALLDAGRADSAAAVLARLAPDDLPGREARERRASMLAEAGAHGHALAAYARLAADSAARPDVLESATRAAAAIDRWGDVLWFAGRLEAVADDRGARLVAARHRALAQEARGDPTAALETYRRIASPGNLPERASLADRTGADSLAAALYADLAERTGDPEYRLRRAAALVRAGRSDRALGTYAGLRADGALDREGAVRYARLLRQRDRGREAWELLRSRRPRPAEAGEAELWVSAALEAGALEEARRLAEQHLTDDPESAADWRLLARVERAAGEREAAADALGRYLHLRPADASARSERIGLLADLGRREEAAEQGRRLLAGEATDDVELLARLGRQMEQIEAWGVAARAYRRALVAAGGSRPDLRFREAEATRLAGRPREAAARYRKLLAGDPPAEIARRARLGAGRALLASGHPARAIAPLGPVPEPAPTGSTRDAETLPVEVPRYGVEPADSVRLRLLARAAGEADSADVAVRAWEALSSVRALTVEEWTRLAGLYREARRRDRALLVYETLLARADRLGHSPEPDVVAAVADLRLRADRPGAAAEAYRRLADRRLRETRDGLNLARALWADGRRREALDRYRSWLDSNPDAGAEALREAARVHLAAGRHSDAEEWARRALGEDPEDPLSRLLLAESLRFQGRVREAGRRADRLREAEPPSRLTAAEWKARLDLIDGRYRAAWREFGRAAARDSGPAGALLAERTRAAASRGDYARARRALARADSAGAPSARVGELTTQLDRATRPGASALGGLFVDSNDLNHVQWLGLQGELWARDRARLTAALQGATLWQGEDDFDLWRASVGVDSLFPAASLQLGLEAGVATFADVDPLLADLRDADDGLVTGRLGLEAAVRDATRVRFTLRRESVWEATGARGPRQFNRVTDLGRVPLDFSETSAGVGLEHVVGAGERLRLSATGSRLTGGVERLSGSVRYEVRLFSGPDRYTAVTPNLYVEGTPAEVAGIFSPDRYASLGLGFRTIRRSGPLTLDLEANPHVFLNGDEMEAGVWGLGEVSAGLGPIRLGLGAFGLGQTRGFGAGRFFARVRIPGPASR